jgi:hypothetical protein
MRFMMREKENIISTRYRRFSKEKAENGNFLLEDLLN